jgi:hypothetical protein
MDEIIEQYYEDYNYPSVDKLYKLLKDDGHEIKKKDIKEFIDKQKEAQILKETKKSKKQLGHITSLKPNYVWQLDIYYMMKYHKQNKEFKYILACMDVFTRKAYCLPMKNKDNDDVKLTLKILFEEAGVPLVITSDNDATLLSNECQDIFNKHGIIHDVVPKGDHASLGIIDRFARTLKTILHKRFIKYDTTNWIDPLPTIIKKYNNSPNSALDGIKPNDAQLPENIYTIMEINLKKKEKRTTFKNPFNIGDKVRVEVPGMNKKSEGKYSDKVFTIQDVRGKRVVLNDNKVRKYDMLIKVDYNEEQEEQPPRQRNVIRQATQDYRQELQLRREQQDQENIIEGRRTRGNRINYAELNRRGR